jgi:hypothetical protein
MTAQRSQSPAPGCKADTSSQTAKAEEYKKARIKATDEGRQKLFDIWFAFMLRHEKERYATAAGSKDGARTSHSSLALIKSGDE